MNEEKKEPRNRGKGGRPPKNDPAKRRLTVNLTDEQHAGFIALYEQSGVQSLSGFIAARIFGDEFRVVKTDASMISGYRKQVDFIDSTAWEMIWLQCLQSNSVLKTKGLPELARELSFTVMSETYHE